MFIYSLNVITFIIYKNVCFPDGIFLFVVEIQSLKTEVQQVTMQLFTAIVLLFTKGNAKRIRLICMI